jgi:hypothetical protein
VSLGAEETTPLIKGRWKRQIHLHVHRLLEVNEYSISLWYYFTSPLEGTNAIIFKNQKIFLLSLPDMFQTLDGFG